METTANYGFRKPADTDAFDEQYNDNYNMDAIDAALTPTADPMQAPSGNGPGMLVQWVSWFANMIAAIVGGTHWWSAPAITLQKLAAAALILASTSAEVYINTLSPTTVLTGTPTTAGNFWVGAYVRALNGTTLLTFQITYTDAGGSETTTLMQNQDPATGGNNPLPIMINSAANEPITLTATAGVIDEIYVSASIIRG
jgi:hypothetical protein